MARHPRTPSSSSPDGSTRKNLDDESHKGFTRLYDRWHPVVWSSARAHLDSDADADGAAQRVFLRLWGRGPSAWRPTRPHAFFRLAGRNEALSTKRRKRREYTLTDDILAAFVASDPAPDDLAGRSEFWQVLQQAIENLPPRCSVVMSLRVFEDLSYPDIAQRLGNTESAVEHQVARGRLRLQQALRHFMKRHEP